jgi:hypothetical protein
MKHLNFPSSLLARLRLGLGTRRRIRARLGPVFGSCCYLFFSAALLASVSVFDSEETFWAFSRDMFYRAFAPLYPGTQDREASVVLLNDESFRGFDTYPVRYQTHASVLRAIPKSAASSRCPTPQRCGSRTSRTRGGGNRFPDQYLYETLRLVRLPGLTRNLPWAKA